MTANATRRAVPMTGTGDGPRPDPTTFASAARTADERRADGRPADERRSNRRPTGGRRADRREATTNRTAADDPTQ